MFENLLYEDEGTTLDFKREQYRFYGASSDEKSELIKDILAFANAWRRADAFILLGVEERKGARSEVFGISEDLKDSDIQQLINSNTQRPVTFSYHSTTMDGKKVGVIRI